MKPTGRSPILVVGDSIAFARRYKAQLLPEAWPFLLREKVGGNLLLRADGGATSTAVVEQVEMMLNYFAAPAGEERTFGWAIVQMGIVDCCPRALPLWLSRLVDRVPGGGRLVARSVLPAIKATGLRGRPWISGPRFQHNLEKILRRLEKLADRVAVLAIAPPIKFLVENAPGVGERVEQYNALLAQGVGRLAGLRPGFVQYCNPWDEPGVRAAGHRIEDLLLEDGHHLSAAGHAWVARRLAGTMAEHAPAG